MRFAVLMTVWTVCVVGACSFSKMAPLFVKLLLLTAASASALVPAPALRPLAVTAALPRAHVLACDVPPDDFYEEDEVSCDSNRHRGC